MRPTRALLCLALVVGSTAVPAARADERGARVIVSTTLNDTLQFFDAASLTELQPPLPSAGGGPVRLAIATIGGTSMLFSANHGVAEGSVGVFSLEGDLVVELPGSPAPARPGSVGIDAGYVSVAGGSVPMVFVTNDWNALGPCAQMPNGSVTAYRVERPLAALPVESVSLVEVGTVDTSGALPYAVSIDPSGRAFASNNCSATLDTITITSSDDPYDPRGLSISRTATRATGAGADGTVFDAGSGLNYTVNIAGSSVSVHDAFADEAVTTVPLPGGARPIESTLADTTSGRRLLLTANGGDDTMSVIDRTIVAACVAAAQATCAHAEVARIATAVKGGAPEGIAYDPATNRAFVVNKTFPPSLSVMQLVEHADGSIHGSDVARIPLTVAGATAPVPAVIAFDVVVQPR